MPLPHDPVAALGLEGFAKAMREGNITSEQAVRAYLSRIEQLDPLLNAFEYVNADRALAVARAMDTLLASGVDLGPLMGLPISVKDIFVLDGCPPHAGSNLPLGNKFSSQDATFVKALKEAGCVIVGTTRMVEFALGITGHSTSRGTPWNPWDDQVQRLPGGSSSGAGVALAAGLCAMSIGTDTGGSVRVPAALCGLFGLKTTAGRWPNDGAFPLDPETDTIGIIARTARDAQLAFHALDSRLNGFSGIHPPVSHVRCGRPATYMLDDLSPDVSASFDQVIKQVEEKGATVSSVDILNIDARERYFPVAMPAQLLSWLGEETFKKFQEDIDPTIRERVVKGLNIKAHDFLAVSSERRSHASDSVRIFDDIDVILSPTTQVTAPPVSELSDPDYAMKAAMGMTRNTQPANYFDWCAATIPIGLDSDGLPIGLQINAKGMKEDRLLSIAIWMESVVGNRSFPPQFRGFDMF